MFTVVPIGTEIKLNALITKFTIGYRKVSNGQPFGDDVSTFLPLQSSASLLLPVHFRAHCRTILSTPITTHKERG